MVFNQIQTLVKSLPELKIWPELADVFDRAGSVPRPDWELPLVSCEAVGGEYSDALYCAAAVACLQLSIILIDDILDDDLRGAHIQLGIDRAANFAIAYQAAAIRLIGQTSLNSRQQAEIMSCIGQSALATAAGQNLDIQNLQSEQDYWDIIKAKSTPFYGAALKIGALVGSADEFITADMYKLGVLFGEIIQLEDDLEDALEKPANADWKKGRNNLLILFARTAKHDKQMRFLEILPLVDKPDMLDEAQQILVSSGAVAYCIYHMVHRYQASRNLLNDMVISNSDPLVQLLDQYEETLKNLLRVREIEILELT